MPVFASARRAPLRIVTAVPLCDGHDSAITTINLELAREGVEVVYLGYNQSASTIARAAVQEDAHAVGLSSYNGGHVVFFREVLRQLRARGAADIPVFGGGGGTITPADERLMQRAGVDRIFFAGTPLKEIVATIVESYSRPRKPDRTLTGDRRLARAITLRERKVALEPAPNANGRAATRSRRADIHARTFTVGVAGPGGAGKSTLIDELTARFLRTHPGRRVGIIANDPSYPDTGGAVLGDRVSALNAQTDRVFFRSLATRGNATGLSAAAPAALDVLRHTGEFDLVFVESVGIGQDGDPFGAFSAKRSMVDAILFVMSPHYGGRIQLQKIALLNGADLVALNKCDDPHATAARLELATRLAANSRHQSLHLTVAAQPNDPGVDSLFAAIEDLAGLGTAGGERACQLHISD